MESFSSWWEVLSSLEKIYWAIGIPFSIFFLIQVVLTFFGGDVPEDGSADFDVDSDTGIGFQFLTLKNLIAFFTIFAWAGIASLNSGLSNTTSIIISIIAGLAMMTVMASLFYFLGKATESGTLIMKNAIGAVGEVYLEVKSNRGNIGKVQVQVQGTLRTLEAITDEVFDLPMGTVVEVTDVANNNILIISKSK